MFRFETLEVWQEAQKLALMIYQETRSWPKNEQYGLTAQVCRSVVSISGNIAEGSASFSVKDNRNYLGIAQKSLFETVSHLMLAEQLLYISQATRMDLYLRLETLAKRIQAYRKSLL
jgi:four helix bundle protein